MSPSPFPGNASFTRWWTLREFNRVRTAHGDEHPDTIEAHVHVVAVWGVKRVPALPVRSLDDVMRRAAQGTA